MNEVSVTELKTMRDNNETFQLIDVRETYEFETANLGGELIPLATLLHHVDRIRKDIPVVIYCRSGSRSAAAIRELEANHGFTNLANLKGGIMAWAREIDSSLDVF